MNLLELRRKADALLADRRLAAMQVKSEKAALAEAKQDVADLTQARDVLQAVAEAVQRQAHQRLAGVVSRCLAAVFGDEAYQLQIDFEKKRGRTEARLLLVRDGLEIEPLDAAGGGVVDVAAFALRIACLAMSRPPLRRLVIADEPFKFVSKAYRPAVRQLLEQLAADFQMQIVFVTHSEELVCGQVVELE